MNEYSLFYKENAAHVVEACILFYISKFVALPAIFSLSEVHDVLLVEGAHLRHQLRHQTLYYLGSNLLGTGRLRAVNTAKLLRVNLESCMF